MKVSNGQSQPRKGVAAFSIPYKDLGRPFEYWVLMTLVYGFGGRLSLLFIGFAVAQSVL